MLIYLCEKIHFCISHSISCLVQLHLVVMYWYQWWSGCLLLQDEYDQLLKAVCDGNIGTVKKLLDDKKFSIETRGPSDYPWVSWSSVAVSCLHWCCEVFVISNVLVCTCTAFNVSFTHNCAMFIIRLCSQVDICQKYMQTLIWLYLCV